MGFMRNPLALWDRVFALSRPSRSGRFKYCESYINTIN